MGASINPRFRRFSSLRGAKALRAQQYPHAPGRTFRLLRAALKLATAALHPEKPNL